MVHGVGSEPGPNSIAIVAGAVELQTPIVDGIAHGVHGSWTGGIRNCRGRGSQWSLAAHWEWPAEVVVRPLTGRLDNVVRLADHVEHLVGADPLQTLQFVLAGGIAVRKDPIGALDHCPGERAVRMGQEHWNGKSKLVICCIREGFLINVNFI